MAGTRGGSICLGERPEHTRHDNFESRLISRTGRIITAIRGAVARSKDFNRRVSNTDTAWHVRDASHRIRKVDRCSLLPHSLNYGICGEDLQQPRTEQEGMVTVGRARQMRPACWPKGQGVPAPSMGRLEHINCCGCC